MAHGRLAVLDRAPQLDHALARDQHAGRQLGPARQGPADLGQAVAVGRDHARGRAVRFEQHARQVLAGLVQRDGEDGLGDHVAQRGRVDLEGLGLLNAGELGVVAVGHPDDLELDLAAADLGPVLLGAADADLVAGQTLDDLVELARDHGQAAFLLDLGLEAGDGA